MKKKAIVIIVVVVIVILIGFAIYLFVKGGKGKNLDKDGNIIDPTKDKDGKLLETPPIETPPLYSPPLYSPTPPAPQGGRCTNDAFPLGRGAKNQCVVALQTALRITADGNFGPLTEAAVRAKGYVVPLTITDFDKIIAGISAPVTGAVIKKQDKLKATGYTPIFEDAGLTKPLKTKNSSGGTTGAWSFRKDDYVGEVLDIQGRSLKIMKYTNAPGCPTDCKTTFYVDKYYQYTKA